MKNCQDKEKKNTSIKIIVFFVLFFTIFGINLNVVNAAGTPSLIDVYDRYLEIQAEKGMTQSMKDWVKNFSLQDAMKQVEHAAAVGYKKMLGYFLNEMAYNTAIYLATGDKGQTPMFETDNIGDFITKTADNAAGYFIESLGENGFLQFNLCEPDINIQLKIGLGLSEYTSPSEPECTFTEMKENWSEALSDPNFLNDFQDMFNPWSNDLGIALSVQTGFLSEIEKEKEFKGLGYEMNRGINAVTDSISGKIKTPSWAVGTQLEKTINQANENYYVYTGDAMADAISVFVNTLSGKLLEEWLKEGIVTDFSSDDDSPDDYDSTYFNEGMAGAKERFKELIEPQFGVRGDYDILAELTMCPDPTNAGPTDCVITDNFRQAIESRLTVGQAMELGYLNTSGIFGFNSDGLEPSYNEGYPYRSMIILRKFRILPMGWEVASEYIKDHPTEVDGTKNLGDLVACYSDDINDDYDGYHANWCDGLVDPTWVLKAPLNYCKREGAGPEIIFEQIVGEDYDSERTISRDENYCADEQSCIQENSDGSCNLYGYCTEDRRKWNFDSDSCEPRDNTCQTFRGPEGQTVSYLENTLDYGICSIDNVGCQAYCVDYNFANGDYSCTSDTGNKIYFDNNIEECSVEDEGCHEFIRTKADLGVNILTNSSFEKDLDGTIWEGDGEQVSGSYEGSQGLELSSSLSKIITFGPSDYSVAGQYFSLSFYAKDCGLGDSFSLGGQETTTDLNQGDSWQYYNTTYVYPIDTISNQINFSIISDTCIIDAIKLERGQTVTAYSDYRGQGLVYQKLAPDYLSCDGDNDTDECDSFVRNCSVDEVGCELYTSVNDDIGISAKVVAQDYCPSECVGYDTYIQSETIFDSLRDTYFIPTTAETCGSEAVGCDEFTNLDEVESGGEEREYYFYLRQCISVNDSQCAEFYTWEGSDETGYQLKVLTLKENEITGEPAITEEDSTECNDEIYGLDETDPSYNSDCRQFYNHNGYISYHLYTRTISCSDNCHSYRRTELNVDPEIVLSTDCSGTDKYWDTLTAQCVVCKNSGEWSDQHQACLYMAIPDEGMTCAANEDGCREYSGNTSNNTRFVLNDDFEGSLQDWYGLSGTEVNLSNESLVAGGNSLEIASNPFSVGKIVGQNVFQNKAYVLTFSAKANSASAIISVQLSNGQESSNFTTVSLSDEWQYYEVSLVNLDHAVSSDEEMIITADGSLYINDIRLTEITDRYYLIKDSWETPDSCNRDIDGNPSPLYMLGCEAYYDREDKIHNLHDFSYLCSDSAVGCELMIDTHNYSDYQSAVFNENDDSEVTVAADNYSYVVYDADKNCNQSDKGCQRLGEPYQYEDDILYGDVYIKNNPDEYSEILCEAGAIGCQEWVSTEGSNYFKNPGDMVCEWRQAANTTDTGWGWYKKKVDRCDGDGGDICLNDDDCLSGQTCQTETIDIDCPTTYWKTFGYGGQEARVYQPNDDWVGLCSASQAGCTEYIDPISQFSSNVIFNSNLESPQDVDNNNVPDGWTSSGSSFIQEVSVEPYTLYRLGRSISTEDISLACGVNNYVLNEDNVLSSGATTISLSDEDYNSSKLIYISNNESCTISISSVSGKVELKKAIVDYQLKEDIDNQSCNGVIDFEDGCVLFNERDSDGSSLSNLIWDADLTVSDQSGTTPSTGEEENRDANIIIKVTPDRICDKWLACRSYIKDENDNNVCFDIGLCNGVDPNGNCNSFLTAENTNQDYKPTLDSSDIANMVGYAKVGYANGSMASDYYSFGAMEQEGEMTDIANGNFEIVDSDGYPLGWVYDGGSWDENVFKVVDNPIETQTEGIGYAPEGQGFLKLGSSYSATSEFVDVVGGTTPIDYVITAYVNTINLKSGSAKIKIGLYDSIGNYLTNASMNPDIVLNPGYDWTFKLSKFSLSSANVSRIKVTLYSESGTEGNYYFDDVKIKPALNSKDDWYTPQSCRLYPQTDSLSCDYYDDSGKKQKGWSGYCLEYDRYPGSADACLLWWPVDKVKGEGVEEGAGYIGSFPVYYCLEAESFCDGSEAKIMCTKLSQVVTSTGQNKYWSARAYEGSNYEIPFAEANDGKYINWGSQMGGLESVTLDYTRDSGIFGSIYPPEPVDNPYEWDGEEDTDTNVNNQPLYAIYPELVDNEARAGTPYYIKNNTTCFGTSDSASQCGCPSCSDWKALGQWDICYVTSSYGGQCYVQSDDDYNWEWQLCDICDNDDCDSCTVSCYNQAGGNMASSFSEAKEGAKRIFTQSYGSWEWEGDSTNGVYRPVTNGQDWGPPTRICSGGVRPAYPSDYCAILPYIENIKINNEESGNIELAESQFVNLTFNSIVDSQQMPVVMYTVDWGDGENTVVTGVEMHSRPDEDNPHSLYHLYNYWDLKAKDASGVSGIDCSAEGECWVQPKVKIKDNWGWCNGSTAMNDCEHLESFVGWIVVKER